MTENEAMSNQERRQRLHEIFSKYPSSSLTNSNVTDLWRENVSCRLVWFEKIWPMRT